MGAWLFMAGGGAVALGGVLVVVWALGWDRARERVRCPKCWYDMRGVPAGEGEGWLCPECGGRIARQRGLRRTRRRWRWAAVGLLAAVAGVVLFDYPNLRGGGWQKRLPTTALILLLPHVEETWVVDTLARRLYGIPQTGSATTPRALPGWQQRLLANRAIAAARAGMPGSGGLMLAFTFIDDPRPLIPALMELTSSDDSNGWSAAVAVLNCFRHDMDPAQLAEAIALLESAAADAARSEQYVSGALDLLREAAERALPSVHDSARGPPPTPEEMVRRLDGAGARESLVVYRELGVPSVRRFYLPYSRDAGPLKADLFALDLNGDGRDDAVVRVGDGWGVHWDLHVFIADGADHQYVCSLGTYTHGLSRPDVRVERTPDGRAWMVLRTLWGSSDDLHYALWGDVWFSVDRRRARRVFGIPVKGSTSYSGPLGAADWEFSAKFDPGGDRRRARYVYEARFHPPIDLTLAMAEAVRTHSIAQVTAPDGEPVLRVSGGVDLVWNRWKGRFVPDYAESPWKADPLEVLLGTPDDFLRHNAAALVRLAETGDDRQRAWVRALVEMCTPSAERWTVEEALGRE